MQLKKGWALIETRDHLLRKSQLPMRDSFLLQISSREERGHPVTPVGHRQINDFGVVHDVLHREDVSPKAAHEGDETRAL